MEGVDVMEINFILGFVRSGSTMIMGLCREHPEIETDLVEPNFLFQLLEKVHYTPERYQTFGIDAASAIKMYDKGVRAFTERFYAGLCSWTGKKDVVIKHPYLTKHIFRLSRIFPTAKFLVLVRHPADVIASTFDFTQKTKAAADIFGKGDLKNILKMYVEWMAPILQAGLVQEKVMVAKFEDFIASPATFLKTIFNFFGKPLDLTEINNIIKLANANKLSLVGSALGGSVIKPPRSKFETLFQEPGKNLIRAQMRSFTTAFGYKEK